MAKAKRRSGGGGWQGPVVALAIVLALARVAHPHPGGAGHHQPQTAGVTAAKLVSVPYLGTTLPPESTMIRHFGQPGDPSRETWVRFAGHAVQVNKVLAANVRQLGRKLAAAGYSRYIRDVGGFRTSVGASGSPIPFSMHQFGAAFDVNEDDGPNGAWNTMTLPARLVAIAASYGWFCGQAWHGASRDGGHFQYTGGRR